MFPELKNIEPVLKAIEGRKEFRVIDLDDGTSVICYMVSEKDSFDDPLRCECRGITFDRQTGDILLRPYHKFFNINERPETHQGVLKDLSISYITSKLDGSMVAMTRTWDGKIISHYKKSVFTNHELYDTDKFNSTMKHVCAWRGESTFLFERLYKVVDEKLLHVLDYEQDELVLLDIRNNFSGEYYEREYVKEVADRLGVRCVQDVSKSFKELIESAEGDSGIEGYVVNYGDLKVKIKTLWYANIHHLVGVLSERYVAKLVLSEQIDDAKAALSNRLSEEQREWLEFTEQKVVSDFNSFKEVHFTLYEKTKHLDMKEVAATFSKGDLGKINIMRKGKEPDWKDLFTRQILKDRYSTDQVFGGFKD